MSLSKAYYEKCKFLLAKKQCYDNIAKVCINQFSEAKVEGDIKVIYGAYLLPIKGTTQFYAKHCYLKINNEIVDPTAIANNISIEMLESTLYLDLISLEVNDYLDKLAKCGYNTMLSPYIEKNFRDKELELLKKDIILVG